MIIILIIFGLMSVGYSLLIFYIYTGWKYTPIASTQVVTEKSTGVSILVAARNESASIQSCIKSILQNDFPQECYEIIIIDDHSTDNTVQIVEDIANHQVRVITLPPELSGKKAAITFGVSKARFPIIVCTDADCIVGRRWLYEHQIAYLNKPISLCTGLVLTETNDTVLYSFQWLDFAASMAITANGILRQKYFLANGANVSFTKKSFQQHKGFEGNDHLASGDDLFLMQKISGNRPDAVSFLKTPECIVWTKAEPDWYSLFMQRKRWATKSLHAGDKVLISIQTFVFGYSILILTGLICGVFISGMIWYAALFAFAAKGITDFFFLNSMAIYFNEQKVMKHFPICYLLYFFHIILSGWFALFPHEFAWKDRKVS